MINIKNFDSNLLKIDKKLNKNVGIYYIGFITIQKIGDYENIYCVIPLYLIVKTADEHIEEKMKINTQLLFVQTRTKKYWKNTQNFGMRLNI